MKPVLLFCVFFFILSGCANSGNLSEEEIEEPQKVNWQDLWGADKRIAWLELLLDIKPREEQISFSDRTRLQTQCENYAADIWPNEDSDFQLAIHEYRYSPRWDKCLVKQDAIFKLSDIKMGVYIFDAMNENKLIEYTDHCDDYWRSMNRYSEEDIWKKCVGRTEIENVWSRLKE